MTELMIKAQGISKKYPLYEKPVDRLKEALHPLRKKYHHDFYALNDVSFEIKKGETVGILGKNGSGKSTLLKILSGVLTPTSGSYTVNGRIASILELGAGFNPELTGVENIYFNCTILGFSHLEMQNMLEEIIQFADLGDFINQPVKMYSSGMYMRLAFAIAVQMKPEVLIVDEALAVGDIFFQAKCMERMRKMINGGMTLLFVSHDTGAIKSFCNKTIFLNQGSLYAFGDTNQVVEKYFAFKIQENQKIINHKKIAPNGYTKEMFLSDSKRFQKSAKFQRVQNGKAKFINVELLNVDRQVLDVAEYDQAVILRMRIEALEDLRVLAFGYHIRDKNGVDVLYTDSLIEDTNLTNVKNGELYDVECNFSLSILHGDYSIATVLSVPLRPEFAEVDFCDFVPIAVQFNMQKRSESALYGYVHVQNSVSIKKLNF